jgi:hypothetical protein
MEYEIGADEPVSTAVVRAVSAVDGCEPSALPPLAGVVDPEALDALFEFHPDGGPRRGGRLSFVYDHCRVAVDNGEYLTVCLLDGPSRRGGERDSNCADGS